MVLRPIRETGKYLLNYRLFIRGEPVFVSLKIPPFRHGKEERILAGVRRWQIRDGHERCPPANAPQAAKGRNSIP